MPNPFQLLNPKAERLNPEKLRTFPGFEKCSDAEAGPIIDTLTTLANVLLKAIKKPFYGAPQVVALPTSPSSHLTLKAA